MLTDIEVLAIIGCIVVAYFGIYAIVNTTKAVMHATGYTICLMVACDYTKIKGNRIELSWFWIKSGVVAFCDKLFDHLPSTRVTWEKNGTQCEWKPYFHYRKLK